MKRILIVVIPGAFMALTIAALEGACNDVGSCPGPSSIVPGGACEGNQLECPFTLQTPSPACDGTTVDGGLATSCICNNGAWSCPSPVTCDSGAIPTEDAEAETGGEGGDAATD